MIILQVGNNGLGNHLYTYALGITLEMVYGKEEILYDISQLTTHVRGRKMYDIQEILGLEYPEASIEQIREATGMRTYRRPFPFSKRYRDDEAMIRYVERLWRTREKNEHTVIIDERTWAEEQKSLQEIKGILDTNKECRYFYLIGYWQNVRFFSGYEREIRSRLHFNLISDKAKDYLEKIRCTKAVSVHFRRGDFLLKGSDLNFCVCHRSYYLNAFTYIEMRNKDVHYYFFSDDVPYIKGQFPDMKNITFVEGLKDYEDLYLMTQCNINVISNSTFSFWGGFLNCHKDVLVIAPKLQYLKKKTTKWESIHMSVPEGWIIL